MRSTRPWLVVLAVLAALVVVGVMQATHRDRASSLPARLRALRGHPVVINAWAAWYGRGSAERLLETIPPGYPSYEDPDGAIARAYGLVGTPSTIFYDRTGAATHVHAGAYLRRGDLYEDIALERDPDDGRPADECLEARPSTRRVARGWR